MYRVRIVCVGKTKKKYWGAASGHYAKIRGPLVRGEAVAVKDSPGLEGEERKRAESARILEKIGPRDTLVALHETGKLMNSREFAAFLRPLLESPQGECCFAIGGAMGLSPELLTRADRLLSLSPMTMPHELAQVVLYEQLFRAMTILANRTYHY
jgi:23S rRNA (pseudouridine1915-N3)-methyltransferase